MVPTFAETPVDAPRARDVLDAYVRERADGFAQRSRAYTPAAPDPALFTPPAGVFLLVVDETGTDVGCGGIRRLDDGAAGPRYEVKHLYLSPAIRGRGWGTELLAELEERARSFGAGELVLDTHHSLEAAAALYRRAGFVETPPFNDNPNASRWYAKLLMRPGADG